MNTAPIFAARAIELPRAERKAYHVRRGRSRRRRPVLMYPELKSLPWREARDDGLEVVVGATVGLVKCPDCARCTLQWAEDGFTPGHRICPCCGSHWCLVTREPRAGEPRSAFGNVWVLRRARFYG